ncbi:MAG: hypothetical protein PWQ57_891 [Desulfovibrionales bacterium]|nr:hypothetical protein [Desulfovibrionales bacterium]
MTPTAAPRTRRILWGSSATALADIAEMSFSDRRGDCVGDTLIYTQSGVCLARYRVVDVSDGRVIARRVAP